MSYSVPTNPGHSVNSITFELRNNCPFLQGQISGIPTSLLCDTGASVTTISENLFSKIPNRTHMRNNNTFQQDIRTVSGESLPIKGVALYLSKLESTTIHFMHTSENLAYDAILGSNFLGHYQSVIDFDNHSLRLLPPSEKPPPYPALNLSCSVHAHKTCVLPPNTESIIPATLKCNIDIPPDGLVGIIESKPTLATRYQVCGAATLIKATKQSTVPFRIMNPTAQPVTIYRCTNLGQFSSYEEPHIVSVLGTHNVVEDKSHRASLLLESVDLSNSDLDEKQQAQLNQLLHDNHDIFALNDDELGHTSLVEHHIDTGDSRPIYRQPYRVSPAVRNSIDHHVQQMLDQGIIQPSVSPWAAPVVLVRKKDGTERFCVDYRQLNKVTKRDSHPIPHIQDTLDCLHGTSYFSCLDLRPGYWQVEVDDDSKPKTAFPTHSGLYEFRRMPFGLANAPSTFQRLMHAVLRGLQYQICLVYLDDIIVYSRSFADHINHLNDVFSRLRSANVKLKPSKCSFARSSVEYLGHVVSCDGIRPDPSKIAAVATFPVPRCVRDVRSFLGLANYYRRFIHNFASIASPLHTLTHKNVRFYWDDSCDKAFHTLKSCLTSAPILAYPDFSLPFELNTDTSSTGIGFALWQTQDGQRRAIAYGGRDLNTAERNYSTTEREALAIVEGIKKFRNYLYDRKFVLHTDHHALRWLMSLKDPSGRLARWSLLLQQYDFTIEYKPGKQNSDADALSRRPYGTQFHVSAYDLPGVPIGRIPTPRC